MTRLLTGLAMIGAATLIALPVTYAQAPNPMDFSTGGQQNTQPAPTTLFHIGPFNAVINAPVGRPGDSNIAYQTFQGHPMTGRDAIPAAAGLN